MSYLRTIGTFVAVIAVCMFTVSCESDSSSSSGGGGGGLSSATWVNGNGPIHDWAQTVEISSVNIAGGIVSWTYAKPPGNWPSTGRIHGSPNANVGFTVNIDGTWYAAIGEWLDNGGTWQQTLLFESDRGNTRLFGAPMQNFRPSSGQELYFFVCGLNFGGIANVQERSNLVKVVYP